MPRRGATEAVFESGVHLRAGATLAEVRELSRFCHGCDLWRRGRQTVFGEGNPRATVMLVGAQPGEEEDRQGRPFVGRAGRLLAGALAEAGIDRDCVYVTHVVKHHGWTPRGPHPSQVQPTADEIHACRAWLEAELEIVRPRCVVAMGPIAARALLGRDAMGTARAGALVDSPIAELVLATLDPTAIERADDGDVCQDEMARLVEDLRAVARFLER